MAGGHACVGRASEADLRLLLAQGIREGYTAPEFLAVAPPPANLDGASFFDPTPP